jgi:hypothetical protein
LAVQLGPSAATHSVTSSRFGVLGPLLAEIDGRPSYRRPTLLVPGPHRPASTAIVDAAVAVPYANGLDVTPLSKRVDNYQFDPLWVR